MAENIREEIKVRGEELLKKVKELVHAGNIRRIVIKNEDDKTLLEIPLTIGLVGVALVPIWAAIGALAAFAVHYKLEIIKTEDDKAKEKEE